MSSEARSSIPRLARALVTDLRFTARLYRRTPLFTATILGVLVIGIGATTALFSLVSSVFLRPLSYQHPEELTMVWAVQSQVPHSPASMPDFLDWKAQAKTFQAMAAIDADAFGLSVEGRPPETVSAGRVTGDFFPMFGVSPIVGRLLGPEDDRSGGPKVVVLSADVWRRLGGTPDVVGRSVRLNGEPYTVLGVAPDGFQVGTPWAPSDVWTPMHVAPRDMVTSRGSHYVFVYGRRKTGVALGEAQRELETIAASLATTYPQSNVNVSVRLADLQRAITASSREGIWLVFAGVGLVFLVLCANVASLLLARMTTRRFEIAARAALGASQRRLLGQVVTETAAVFVVAALGGTLLARALVGWLGDGLVMGAVARAIPVEVDGSALGFAIGVALVCGLAFGLFPALEASRTSPQVVLRQDAAPVTGDRSQRFVRGGLVVFQVALAFALLVGSGLSLRAFVTSRSTPLGFDDADLATVRIALPAEKYGDDARVVSFYGEVLARIAAEPGVTAVAANSALPMARTGYNGGFKIEGRPPWPENTGPLIDLNVISPGYFAAMGIPVLRGREFTAADVREGRRVIIVNERMAKKFFPGEDPIGRRIDMGDPHEDESWREIVGVVGDVRQYTLIEQVVSDGFVPIAQWAKRDLTVAVRTRNPIATFGAISRIVSAVDPDQPAYDQRLMSDRVAQSVARERFVMILLAGFAGTALLLATLGLFGLVSYTTSRRTREIGIRMALGASPGRVVHVVVKDGLLLLAIGLVLGLLGGVFLGRSLAARIPNATAFDPGVFGGIFLILALSGLLASFLPAVRAIRIPPSVALRYE